jgi:dTMP kinase
MTSGRFIVLEGGEGAGKSSVQRALGERLRADGIDVVLTREPGGTPLGERIREVVLGDATLHATAELLLFEAARAQLVATVIAPAVERGATVLCDRFAASSIAYQSFGRGLARDMVEDANRIAAGGIEPDLTLLLDIDVHAGIARRAADGAEAGAPNRFDAEAMDFHERVRAGFLTLARESPERWRIIYAAQPLEVVVDAAYEAIVSPEARA